MATIIVSYGARSSVSDTFVRGGRSAWVREGVHVGAELPSADRRTQVGGVLPGFIKTGRGYVIDIRNGASAALNKGFIRGLLKKYPDLAEAYKDKDDIMDYAVEIIIKVNELENR